MKEKRKQYLFKADDFLQENTNARINPDDIISAKRRTMVTQRDIARYYSLLLFVAKTIEISKEEFALICDSYNGVIANKSDTLLFARVFSANIEDNIKFNNAAERFAVDSKTLLEKIDKMSIAERLCLLDAVEMFYIKKPEIEFDRFSDFYQNLLKINSETYSEK